MKPTALLLLTAASAAYVYVQAVYFVHMLQLNSYRPERYAAWRRENRDRLLSPLRLAAPLLLLLFAGLTPLMGGWAAIAAVIPLGLFALLNVPPRAKKPLVFTHRVMRLFGTLALLFAIAAAAAWLLPLWAAPAVYGAFSFPVFWWVALANRINGPLERALANRYVRDARRRLENSPRLTVIGITGSYGKTSAKNFLHALLSVKYNVLMTPESYNTTMGVVRTIREQLRPSHQIFIAEMGAKNPGDIREICDLVRPRYGMITSIGEQHLETFGTVENIIRTKFELADALPPEGRAFLNYDNLHIRGRIVKNVPTVTYGVEGDAGAMYTASDIAVDAGGSRFTVTAPGGESRVFTTRLLGVHNIQNLVGCIAVAHTLGLTLEELVYPVRMLKPVPHRLQLLPNGYIDDAYNSNPAGFRAALDVLSRFEGQRVLVTPGMVELGQRQAELNRELGAYAAPRCDYVVLVGEKQAPPLLEGLTAAGFAAQRIFVAKTLQEGLNWVNGLPFDRLRTVLLENDLPDNF